MLELLSSQEIKDNKLITFRTTHGLRELAYLCLKAHGHIQDTDKVTAEYEDKSVVQLHSFDDLISALSRDDLIAIDIPKFHWSKLIICFKEGIIKLYLNTGFYPSVIYNLGMAESIFLFLNGSIEQLDSDEKHTLTFRSALPVKPLARELYDSDIFGSLNWAIGVHGGDGWPQSFTEMDIEKWKSGKAVYIGAIFNYKSGLEIAFSFDVDNNLTIKGVTGKECKSIALKLLNLFDTVKFIDAHPEIFPNGCAKEVVAKNSLPHIDDEIWIE